MKLHHFQQNSLSVEQYVAEFEELMIKCDLAKSEENIIVRFMSGLKPSIAHTVQL